jgi:uncharacterized protein YjiS (DUF1127 family)
MAMIQTINRPLPPLSRALFALAQVVLNWETRRQTRRSLSRLDAHLLRDIGLTPYLANCECQKTFWRG